MPSYQFVSNNWSVKGYTERYSAHYFRHLGTSVPHNIKQRKILPKLCDTT
uniref:Uncharacterized protein n=1 Tax=Arundo donax TaxID=35708 RepID=A0A0A8Y9B2_ARUDO